MFTDQYEKVKNKKTISEHFLCKNEILLRKNILLFLLLQMLNKRVKTSDFPTLTLFIEPLRRSFPLIYFEKRNYFVCS